MPHLLHQYLSQDEACTPVYGHFSQGLVMFIRVRKSRKVTRAMSWSQSAGSPGQQQEDHMALHGLGNIEKTIEKLWYSG